MSKILNWMMVGSCGLAVVALAWGQTRQKPGLWEVTATMSMAGMPQMPAMPRGRRKWPRRLRHTLHRFA